MGLDISSKDTGVCVAETFVKTPSIVVSGTITLKGVIPGTKKNGKSQRWEDIHPYQRLVVMMERVQAYVEEFKPHFVVIEGYAYASPRRTHLPQLAEVTSLIKHVLWKAKIPYILIPPSQLKKFATGRGNCKKDDMVDFANLLIDADSKCYFDNDNEADAVMLAALGVCLLGSKWVSRTRKEKRWPTYSQDTVSAMNFDPGSTAQDLKDLERQMKELST